MLIPNLATHNLPFAIDKDEIGSAHECEMLYERVEPESARQNRISHGDVAGEAFLAIAFVASIAETSCRVLFDLLSVCHEIIEGGWQVAHCVGACQHCMTVMLSGTNVLSSGRKG
jgi:hypothetical protein